jgi:hypothetical protein
MKVFLCHFSFTLITSVIGNHNPTFGGHNYWTAPLQTRTTHTAQETKIWKKKTKIALSTFFWYNSKEASHQK